ncbi:MAG: hypothetical protein R2795_17285 [Saprospiraceae bacterium]
MGRNPCEDLDGAEWNGGHQLKALSQRGKVTCCYEAGFSGFWLQRSLEQSGISYRVVHPGRCSEHRPHQARKTDMVDSWTLALMLSRDLPGDLRPIAGAGKDTV